MRRIQIRVTCDSCGDVFGEDQSDNVEIRVAGSVYEIDLCYSCRDVFLTGAREKRPTRAKKGTGEFVCLTTGCDKKFGTSRGLSRHVTMAHP